MRNVEIHENGVNEGVSKEYVNFQGMRVESEGIRKGARTAEALWGRAYPKAWCVYLSFLSLLSGRTNRHFRKAYY